MLVFNGGSYSESLHRESDADECQKPVRVSKGPVMALALSYGRASDTTFEK